LQAGEEDRGAPSPVLISSEQAYSRKASEKEPEKIIRVDIMAKTRGFILTIILIIFCEGEC
jgi:hypothetical protein